MSSNNDSNYMPISDEDFERSVNKIVSFPSKEKNMSLGGLLILDSLKKGKTISIPSLKIKLKKEITLNGGKKESLVNQ